MDAKNTDGEDSSGGSGKSLGGYLLSKMMKNAYLSGRNTKLTDNPHVFENINKDTDMVLVDDCHKFLKFDFFFSAITTVLQVNPKNSKQYTILFKDVAKFWFSSNFPPYGVDNSMERRIIYTVFSDYYHYNKLDEYREERRVYDDFGKNLGDDFTPEEWNLFFNLVLQCARLYMSTDHKINPPMESVNKRNLKSSMGEPFLEWAEVYFSEENNRLNDFVRKDDALEAFLKATKQNWTMNKFTNSLRAFANYMSYEFNPKDVQNQQGRVIRTVEVNGEKQSKEMIYFRKVDIKTIKELPF